MIIMPIGIPLRSKPQFTESDGWPVTSNMEVSNGSSAPWVATELPTSGVHSVIVGVGTGIVGVTRASTSAIAVATLCANRRLARCAWM